MDVLPINYDDARQWLMRIHYAKRMCPISFAFGAYRDCKLVGVVTYGVPASSPLRSGICGERFSDRVIELNRLCCENSKNMASMIVGRSLRMIPKPSIVVSYADTGYGHVGYVYQATNFTYTGLSAKRTNWKIKGQENLHGISVADKTRGQENRSESLRKQYGDDFYLEERSRKHRYVFFTGSKRERQEMLSCLNYPAQEYPKGDTKRYEITGTTENQMILFS